MTMNKQTAKLLSAMVLGATILIPAVAEAKHGNNDYYGPGRYEQDRGPGNHWHGDDHDRDRHDGDHDRVIYREAPSRDRVIIVQERNRPVIRDYYQTRFREHCPPGWAKHGRCAPTRHVTYVVGQQLPYDVVYEEVPSTVIVERPPVGYRYVRVDDNVLLIDAARHIIDAVALINAAG